MFHVLTSTKIVLYLNKLKVVHKQIKAQGKELHEILHPMHVLTDLKVCPDTPLAFLWTTRNPRSNTAHLYSASVYIGHAAIK